MIQFRDESLDDSGPMMSNDKSAHDKWGPRSVIKRLLSSTGKGIRYFMFFWNSYRGPCRNSVQSS